MTKTAEIMIALLRGAITGAHEPVDLTGVDLKSLYSFSKLHDVAPIVCDELMRYDILGEDEPSRKFKKQHKLAMFRHLQRDVAIGQIRRMLEAAQIPFILLKGAVLKDFYPQPWMRTSTDVDVLVPGDRFAAAASAFQSAGYHQQATTPHDATFYSPEQYHVELHFLLVEDDRLTGLSGVLSRVWDYTEPAGDGCERRMRDDFFYLYHLAHMAKHFQSGGGCGVRSFLDLWLLDHVAAFDESARRAMLTESRIATFSEQAHRLSEQWFSGVSDPELAEFEDYVLLGGLYGTLDRAVMVRKSKTADPARYLTGRLFLPYSTMQNAYPVLQKHPYLLPVYWVVRWGKLLSPTARKRAAREIRVAGSLDREERARIERLMKQLELW